MSFKNPSTVTLRYLKGLIFLACLTPFLNLGARMLWGDLGANPIERITHSTGYWCLSFLLMTLAVTPVRRLSGWNWLARMRRTLALYSFFYGTLHFLTYLVLDQFFDWAAIVEDIAKRPFITVGFTCLVLMIPLAITSTDGMMRRLGGKRWRILHQLVYPIAMGGVVHFWWLVKKDVTRPAIFVLILALLFCARLIKPGVRRAGGAS